MGAFSTIPLMGQQAPPPVSITSPLQLQQQRLTLQQLANQNALSQQVQQENALKLQAQQEDQNDQQTFQKALQNHTTTTNGTPTTDWDAALAEASPQMRIRNVQAIQNDHYALLKNAAEAEQVKRDLWTNNNGAIGRGLAYVYQTPAEQRPEAYAKVRQDLINQGVIKPDDSNYFPEQPGDLGDNALQAGIARAGYLDTMLKQAQERATTAATLQTTKQTNIQNQFTNALRDVRVLGPNPTPDALVKIQSRYPDVVVPTDAAGIQQFVESGLPIADVPTYEKNRLILQYMQNPQSRGSNIDNQIDPIKYPLENQRAKNAVDAQFASGHPEKAQEEVDKVLEAVRTKERETDPEILRARTQQAISTEVGKQVALARLSPDAFAGIQDPRARTQAENNYEKDSKDYAAKTADAQRLQDFVAAAQSGNKAAPGLLPIVEVRSLLNRVNRNELQSVSSSAGSLYDQLVGKWNKYTEGEPIPPEVLKDTAAIADTMANAAKRQYDFNLEVNRKSYGSKVQPIDLTHVSTVARPRVAMGGYKIGGTYAGKKYLGGDPNDPNSFQSK